MANVVRDPKVFPDAILPDLSVPNPLVTFKREDIAFVYGSRWKQRYFARVGDDYLPEPAQWDITHQTWRKYDVPGPTGPLCDGCHSVNYDVATHTVTEWNVGCEKCHGPGGEHAHRPTKTNIVNPARLDSRASDDVCIQCHSEGRLMPPNAGRLYDWPVGFRVGQKLDDVWQLARADPGKQTFTHFADGTARKNRMQGNDFVHSTMGQVGVTCASCHDVHGTENAADLIAPPNKVCFKCHVPGSSPREPTIEAHTHHAANSAASDCVACHMPKIEQTIGDVNIRAHTFDFITPAMTDGLKVPNPCTGCHADKSTAWATLQLEVWRPRP